MPAYSGTLSVDFGGSGILPVNDSFGSLTQTAGTEITRPIAPRGGVRSKVFGFQYTAAATAHTLTFMTVLDTVGVSTKSESGQAVVNVTRMPTDSSGGLLAAADWVIVQHEDGGVGEYKVSSLSGLAITMTGNLTKDVEEGAVLWYFGAAADHTNRQWTMAASTTFTFTGGDERLVACTSAADNQPILVMSDNATNAGTLRFLAFGYSGA